MNKKTLLSFVDVTLAMCSGIMVLMVLAMIMMNPKAKKGDIPLKAEMVITLEWDKESKSDIDLFFQQNNEIIYFGNKGNAKASLERDDLGDRGDSIVTAEGEIIPLLLNEERITVRKLIEAENYISIVAFSLKPDEGPLDVVVKVEVLNPYRIVYQKTVTIEYHRQEIPIVYFRSDSKGKIHDISPSTKSLVPQQVKGPQQ